MITAVDPALKGLAILILEDEYFLADDLDRLLASAGAAVIGPFSRAKEALAAADRQAVDCAVVDINLGQGPQFVVAQTLHERGVPVVFVTGYDAGTVPANLRDLPRLTKPIDQRRLISTIETATRSCPQ